MRRARGICQKVLRRGPTITRSQLLKQALVVTRERVVVLVLAQKMQDQLRGSLQAPIQKNCPHQGLEQVSLKVLALASPRALFPPTEPDVASEPEVGGPIGQIAGADQVGPKLGQHPLAQVAVTGEQIVADHQLEHRISQKLEPLVGLGQSLLVGMGLVQQSQLKQTRVAEAILQDPLQRFERVILQYR